MKKIFLVFLMLLTAAGCGKTTSTVKKDNKIQKLREYDEAESQAGPKRKIVIGKVKNETRFGNKRLGDIAKDVLISEFSKTNKFIVLEREDLDAVMEETEFSNALGQGIIADQQQFLDAEYVIVGSITKYAVNTTGSSKIISKSKEQRAEVAIDIKVIDVRTGKVWSELGEGYSTIKYGTTLGVGTSGGYDESLEQEAFRAAAINSMENIIERISKTPWSAKVAKAYSNRIIITSGKMSNLEIGTKLDVFKQGEKIEFEGEFLGYIEEKIGTAKIVDYMGEDAAVAAFDGERFDLPAVVKIRR
ncbi:CsgG/HfaB family protein [uncultured Ilyobacter sp.]|uniref:CsgG/HfaB family protein n=1 Tax=uncultured Ilyobacter sp. TaxID=544433 RepID=UPI0029C85A6F|nr:CsgG/HfaB family protein [uncultured Ilyobacter sp.]